MDLESECSVLESVEDNEEIANDSVSESLGNISGSNVQNNGSYEVENNDNHELFPELMMQGGAEVSGYVGSPTMDLKPDMSPFSSSVKKGHGLRKWRRFKRDANRDGDSSIDTGKTVAQDSPRSAVNPSKRPQYAERKQRSEGSVSSTNAVVRNMDGFALIDDSGLGLGLGPPFAAGTDSENSEDRSSKSSTAASAPKMKYEIPVFVGFPHNKSRTRSLSGKNLVHPVQRGQQGKGRIESTKKARGEWVKIEKENSHSSMESDSRSSNFVFMQGTCSLNNGTRNERTRDYGDENDDEVQGSGEHVNDGHHGGYGKDGGGGYGDLSPVADSSSEIKEERSENHHSMTEHDPLEESVFALLSVQEALEKEVLKFKEIGNDVSVDGSISDLCTEFVNEEQNLHKTSSEQSQGGEGLQSYPQSFQSIVAADTANGDVLGELEALFKQKVEAEVEYLTISRTVQMMRIAAVDQITLLEDQKALASEQTRILDKLGAAENKAAKLEKEAEKLENFCEDIADADDMLKLQKRIRKYSAHLLMQLGLLVVILSIIMSQISPNHVEVVPT